MGGGSLGEQQGGVKKGRPQDGPRPRAEVGGSAFGQRGDSSIGRTRAAPGVLSWGQRGRVDTASRVHLRKRGNLRGLGRSGARRQWRAGAGVRRSETPSKHVWPAWRGGQAVRGSPAQRTRGPRGGWSSSRDAAVQGVLSWPSLLPPALCVRSRLQSLGQDPGGSNPACSPRAPGPPDPASGIASRISSVLLHPSLGSGSGVTVRGCQA